MDQIYLDPPKKNYTAPILVSLVLVFVFTVSLVSAYLFGRSQSPAPVTSTLTPTPTPTLDSTTNWLPQIIDDISFKSPSTWTLNTEKAFSLRPPTNLPDQNFPAILVYAIDNPQDLTIDQYDQQTGQEGMGSHFYSSLRGNQRVVATKTTFGDVEGYLLEDENCEPLSCDTFAFVYKHKIYVFTNVFQSQTEPQPDKSDLRATFHQILSTLKFTSQVDTSNWKIYTDKVGKFTFMYPASYSLETDKVVTPVLNRKITWRFDNTSYKDCRGDCLVVASTKDVMVANQKATRIEGYMGDVGGNPAQSYLVYEIPWNGQFLLVSLQELPIYLTAKEQNQYQLHNPQPFDSETIKLFDQILSTFQFTN